MQQVGDIQGSHHVKESEESSTDLGPQSENIPLPDVIRPASANAPRVLWFHNSRSNRFDKTAYTNRYNTRKTLATQNAPIEISIPSPTFVRHSLNMSPISSESSLSTNIHDLNFTAEGSPSRSSPSSQSSGRKDL